MMKVYLLNYRMLEGNGGVLGVFNYESEALVAGHQSAGSSCSDYDDEQVWHDTYYIEEWDMETQTSEMGYYWFSNKDVPEEYRLVVDDGESNEDGSAFWDIEDE